MLRVLLCCGCLMTAVLLRAAEEEPVVQRDLVYGQVDKIDLKLDLHLPPPPKTKAVKKQPLIVWLHGGMWRTGSKSNMPLGALVAEGIPVASVDYRLTPVARFPAQAHDIKAAIRYLRGNATKLGIEADVVIIAGNSAGGHLANLIGTTNGNKELEGNIGEHLKKSSDVQGIMAYSSMTNLTTILDQSTPYGLGVRIPALQLLFGGQPDDEPELAKLASPVFHVTKDSPPLVMFHGEQDPQVPINQVHELQGKYEELGLPSRLVVLHNVAHGGKEFYDEKRMGIAREFVGQVMAAEGAKKSSGN